MGRLANCIVIDFSITELHPESLSLENDLSQSAKSILKGSLLSHVGFYGWVLLCIWYVTSCLGFTICKMGALGPPQPGGLKGMMVRFLRGLQLSPHL